jgi:magnesium transporter
VLQDGAYYEDGRRAAACLSLDDARRALDQGSGFVWLSLVDPTEAELGELGAGFGLHELAQQDMLSEHERPKLEELGNQVELMILRTAHHDRASSDPDSGVHFGELGIFIGPRFVISARKGGPHAQGTAREKLESRPDLLELGVSSVLWAIVDKVVGDIRPVIDTLDEQVLEAEAEVFSESRRDPDQRLYHLRNELALLYRAVHPMIAPLEAVASGAQPQFEPMRPYLRDASDAARLLDEDIVGLRDRLTSALEANLALIARRQNEVVRKVSGWAAILAVPTLIASVYGMNFQHTPGLDWRLGFPLCIAVMVAVGALLYWGLRRARWM